MAKKTKKHQQVADTRPPIVTIMGHVDHGKTTLLDTIRKSRVVQSEHGGITQHIGAYQVEHQGQKITFIDTPGHAAFTEMRSRGVNVTDVVVLVVAADDGVKPQTVESIRLIQKAGVPFIVAINKVDLPQASVETVKAQLTEYEVFVEGYGGQTPVLPISAKKGDGVDQLLELILLLFEMAEVSASKENPLMGVVIESKLDRQAGIMATIIVQDGILTKGDIVFVGNSKVKIRVMKNDLGQVVSQAYPGDPVQVYGFGVPPQVGSLVTDVVYEEKKLSEIQAVSEENLVMTEKNEADIRVNDKKLQLIIKADTQGTLEAIITSVMQDEIELISSGVGAIGEADVMLAQTTKAEVIGFNVEVNHSALRLAELDKVVIHNFSVIYKLIEYLEEKVLQMIEPAMYEETVGSAKVLAVFDIRGDRIAGCMVESGKLEINQPIRVMRKEVVVGESKIATMKQGKTEVKIGKAGKECGVVLADIIDFRVGDVLKCYRIIHS